MPQLIIYREGAEILRVLLDRAETVIGRGDEAQLLLVDDEVSRRHAVIREEDGEWTLESLAKNGTLLDGNPVERAPLKNGARISIGPFKCVFGNATAAAADATRTISREPTRVLSVEEDGRKVVVERAELQATDGPDKGKTWKIAHERVVIGKAAGCDVELTDSYVSAQHVRVEHGAHGFRIRDLGSTNGTTVDGTRVSDSVLPFGSEIRLGRTALKLLATREERALPRATATVFEGMVGHGPRMREVFSLLEAVAASDAPVLVLGESGTGKELAARAIHNRSHRATRTYLALNAGAISPTLVESELFGHEKGAFTGADRRRQGAFERASGGTLFLDEVGELSLEVQTKLLRVLETGELQRVGGSDPVKADVRLVAATHRDLAGMVKEKKFREDLFFRLYVVPVRLPPLRERAEDIPQMVAYLLASMNPPGKPREITPAAMKKLRGHTWPGNVRELKNTLQRAQIFARDGAIDVPHVVFTPLSISDEAARGPLADAEREAVLAALRKAGGNRRRAAEELGVARSTLFEKLKRYGISTQASDDEKDEDKDDD
ncbi:MAG TPA: sigma 54-interacting transcriptional regulator [bacterium]|nr:sigma 54-interacting transcriptional regulator [bacterium]